jgi:DNA-binding PadR family transcriptional regulator
MRKPVTDIALLAYIAKKNADSLSYTEATKACKSSSSASRALHQLIEEGLIEPKPKLVGLRYVTSYAITQRGKQVSQLALQLSQLRESAQKMKLEEEKQENTESNGVDAGKEVSTEDAFSRPNQTTKEKPAGGKKPQKRSSRTS